MTVTVSFGKYRGEDVQNIPDDYLLYVIRVFESSYWKCVARDELLRRGVVQWNLAQDAVLYGDPKLNKLREVIKVPSTVLNTGPTQGMPIQEAVQKFITRYILIKDHGVPEIEAAEAELFLGFTAVQDTVRQYYVLFRWNDGVQVCQLRSDVFDLLRKSKKIVEYPLGELSGWEILSESKQKVMLEAEKAHRVQCIEQASNALIQYCHDREPLGCPAWVSKWVRDALPTEALLAGSEDESGVSVLAKEAVRNGLMITANASDGYKVITITYGYLSYQWTFNLTEGSVPHLQAVGVVSSGLSE